MSSVIEETIRIWRCDVCRKEEPWNDNWFAKTIMHRSNGGWDEDITVCSLKCAQEFDRKHTRKRRAGGSR